MLGTKDSSGTTATRTTLRFATVTVGALVGTALLFGPPAAHAAPAHTTGRIASGGLPDTGSSPVPWIIGAVIVLALGAGLYAWSRRRSSDESATPPSA